jgi:hypothetical protein
MAYTGMGYSHVDFCPYSAGKVLLYTVPIGTLGMPPLPNGGQIYAKCDPSTGCAHEAQMKTKTCPECNGDGVVDKGMDDEHQCPTCGGCGFVPDDDDDEDVLNASLINHP